MCSTDIEKILSDKGIKPTSNRILVMRSLLRVARPVSLADLEQALDYSVDKASLFRVLELFASRDVVHVIEDGSRALKYELCHSPGSHSIADQHAHFYCEKCKTTYCLEAAGIPLIDIPTGFAPHSINYLVKGLCPSCNR